MYNIFKSYGLTDDIDKIQEETKQLTESLNCNINSDDIADIDISIHQVTDECEDYSFDNNPSKEDFFDSAFKEAFNIDVDDEESLVARGDKEPLTEDFGNFPKWLIDALKGRNSDVKRRLLAHNIDLAHATFTEAPIPHSSRDVLLRTDTKIPIALVQWPTYSKKFVWLPGINEEDNDWENASGTYFSTLKYVSKKELLDNVKRFGYIEFSNPDNVMADTRRERRERHSTEVTRGKGQYPVKRNVVYGKTPSGFNDYKNVLSYDIEWITDRGYDKSGYKLDPSKYTRMLDNVGLDTYSERLQKYFNQIEDGRSKLIEIMHNIDIEKSMTLHGEYDSFSRNIYETLSYAIRSLSNAIGDYKRLKEEIEGVLNRPDEKWDASYTRDDAIRDAFRWKGRDLRGSIKEMREYIVSLEKSIAAQA